MKPKIDTPFAPNLFKTATSFLYPQAKLKNLLSLLLNLVLNTSNVSINLLVESDDLICFCKFYNVVIYNSIVT